MDKLGFFAKVGRRETVLRVLAIVILLTGILAACSRQAPEPEVVEVTRIVTETEVVEGESVEVTRVVVETETVTETIVETVEVPVAPETTPVGEWLYGTTAEGPVYITDPAQFPTEFHESPLVTALVEAGDLPPVEERLPNPEDLLVIEPAHEIGTYGGIIRRGFTGPGDNQNAGRFAFHDQLLYWNYDMTAVAPGVAKGYEVSEDGTTTTLFLREGLKWSDGEPVTADDIMWWYNNLVLNEECTPTYPPELTTASGRGTIEKVDDFTVQYVFQDPFYLFPEFLAALNYITGHALHWGTCGPGGIAPAHYLEQFHPDFADSAALDALIEEEGFTTWTELINLKNDANKNPELPVLSAWKTRVPNNTSTWVLERNPYWYGVDTAGNQLPYIDEIVMTIAENTEVLTLRAIAGEYDFQARHILLDRLPVFLENMERGDYTLRFQPGTFGSVAGLQINHSYELDPYIGGLLNDINFKRALSLGIDRDQINEAFFLGLGRVGSTIPDASNPYYPGDEYLTEWHTLDVETANQMLDELGLDQRDSEGYRLRSDNGERLRIEIRAQAPATLPVNGVAEMIGEQWKQIGIFGDVVIAEGSLQTLVIQSNEHQIVVWENQGCERIFLHTQCLSFPNFAAHPLGPLYGDWLSSGGETGKEPPEIMKQVFDMWQQGKSLPDEERAALGQEMYRIITDEMWTIGTVGIVPGSMGLAVQKNNLGNIADKRFMSNFGQVVGLYRPETWYWMTEE